MFYWLTNAAASSARMYWENFKQSSTKNRFPITFPAGFSVFPEEIMAEPRSWSEKYFTNIKYWNEVEKGGHFVAFEQPQLFVEEIPKCMREIG